VAFGAALGVIPLDMPESVLVKFTGEMQPGITLRDLVNAIPYAALQRGLLTVEKKGKKNIYNGRILEIQGLPDLTVEQAFELSDASAERSAGGCTIELSEESVAEYLRSNITMLRWMIDNGYEDARTLERRARAMEEWLENLSLMRADADAEYAEVIEINMSDIKEPLLACPNDPDDVKPLSEIADTQIDEVFIGSCMTNIGHFRATAKLLEASGESILTRLWLAPPTKMDEQQLMEEGVYNIYASAGARTEMPGCSLCMGTRRALPQAPPPSRHQHVTSPTAWGRAQMSSSLQPNWPQWPPSWASCPQWKSTWPTPPRSTPWHRRSTSNSTSIRWMSMWRRPSGGRRLRLS
jgi:aconitate hydratase 2/2-methylisocitrate dehydratase